MLSGEIMGLGRWEAMLPGEIMGLGRVGSNVIW